MTYRAIRLPLPCPALHLLAILAQFPVAQYPYAAHDRGLVISNLLVDENVIQADIPMHDLSDVPCCFVCCSRCALDLSYE